jgi:Fe-S-cluster containining protein
MSGGGEEPGRTEFNLRLKLGDSELVARVSVPTAPIRPADLLPVLQSLDDALVDAAIETVGREGKPVSCRAGCGACCRQLVPISPTEARYLAELVAGLPEDRRRHVVKRFLDAAAALEPCGMLDRLRAASELAEVDEKGRLARDYFRAQVACPFLEDESCSIHPDRPLSCREYLVTSPAARCKEPEQGGIEKVPLYAKPTRVLFCFGDGEGRGEPSWLPLVLLAEWAAAHGGEAQPRLAGDRMFRAFLDRLGR